MSLYPLTDEQWTKICTLFPPAGHSYGRRPRDPRTIVNAIFWVEDNHAKWQDLPAQFGPSQTAYIKWLQWRRCGLMDRIMIALDLGDTS